MDISFLNILKAKFWRGRFIFRITTFNVKLSVLKDTTCPQNSFRPGVLFFLKHNFTVH